MTWRRLELLCWHEMKRIWSLRFLIPAAIVDLLAFVVDNFGVLQGTLSPSKFYAIGGALTLAGTIARVIVQVKKP